MQVVGAGIAGIACARALAEAGQQVTVHERAAAPGGRMESRQLAGRIVDLGAAYFTAADPQFLAVLADWLDRGLAREWTDTFAVADRSGVVDRASGPMRYAAPSGLASLVTDLASTLDVQCWSTFRALEGADPIVLAHPHPDLTWEPALSVVVHFGHRRWAADLHGAFVNEHPVLSFIADDGDRRGDFAPVLVAHSTAAYAREHLGDPERGGAGIAAALHEVLGIREPGEVALVRAWTPAKPAESKPVWFELTGHEGWCGDAFVGAEGGSPRVESAWRSGTELGRALAAHSVTG